MLSGQVSCNGARICCRERETFSSLRSIVLDPIFLLISIVKSLCSTVFFNTNSADSFINSLLSQNILSILDIEPSPNLKDL